MPALQLDRIEAYVRHWAAAAPDDLAMRFGARTTTYAELAADVEAWGKALLASKVEAGDRVAVLSAPGPQFWTIFLAVGAVGAVFVGLNPRYTPREVRHVLDDGEPVLLLAQGVHRGRDLRADLAEAAGGSGAVPELVLVDDASSEASFLQRGSMLGVDRLAARRDAVQGEDAALIVYTSGTTGAPKGAVLPHRGIARDQEANVAFARGEGVICNLPINHVAGTVDTCCAATTAGATLVFFDRFDAGDMLAAIDRGELTRLFQVPTMLQELHDHPRRPSTNFAALTEVGFSGAPIAPSLLRWLRGLGVGLSNSYGTTETVVGVTCTDPGASDDQLLRTIGRPERGVEVRVVDVASGDPARDGAEGELLARHPGMMLEYWRRPEASAAAFTPDGFYRTGDLVRQRPDGNLVLTGRRTEMYKSGGYNVYPRELEGVLEAHADVTQAAVVGVSDPLYHEVGHAHVTLRPGAAATLEELEGWMRARLANYKIPKQITIHERLPQLDVGKVDKRALRELPT